MESEQILTKKQKLHPSPGDDASTAEAAPGRDGRGEQGEARRASSTPNCGPHLELLVGRLRLKTYSKTEFSIAQTTGQHFGTLVHVFLLCCGCCLAPDNAQCMLFDADGKHGTLQGRVVFLFFPMGPVFLFHDQKGPYFLVLY